MKLLVAGFLLLTLAVGCYPASEVRVVDSRPKLAIKNAPDNAILYVDGLNMGLANRYGGESSSDESAKARILLLEPGRHKIIVKLNGKILLSEDVFLGEGILKTLKVRQQ